MMKGKGNGISVVEARTSVEPATRGPSRSNEQSAKETAGLGSPRLVGRLLKEASARGIGLAGVASDLGVSPGYLRELRAEREAGGHMPPDFIRACARFLGVPGIVVKLIAGIVTTEDFAGPEQTHEEAIDRAMRRMMQDAMATEYLPANPCALPYNAKKALVAMYADFTSSDVFGLAELPATLQLLKRAAACADKESEPDSPQDEDN